MNRLGFAVSKVDDVVAKLKSINVSKNENIKM